MRLGLPSTIQKITQAPNKKLKDICIRSIREDLEASLGDQFISNNIRALVLILLGSIIFAASAQKKTTGRYPYASNKPLAEPTIFAEGIISTGDHETHPAFTPDGETIYFLKNSPMFTFWTIVVSHFEGGRWTTPEVAPFSGQYRDADPFITPDGSRFYFISDRPVAGKTSRDLDIYVMERTGTSWGEPRNLGAPVNSAGNEWYPTLASDGTIYFGSDRPGGKGRTDIYRCRFVDGKYAEPENLGDAINTALDEFEPFIAPDESYLIFMAGGRPDGLGGLDIYLSHKGHSSWTKAVNLGDKINSSSNEYSPKISPDGKYFFWSSTRGFGGKPFEKRLNFKELLNRLRSPRNGLGDIYQIDIRALNLDLK
jgi:Tol biopolymer transport system component